MFGSRATEEMFRASLYGHSFWKQKPFISDGRCAQDWQLRRYKSELS